MNEDGDVYRNYYPRAHEEAAGLRYRLDGSEIIQRLVDRLKGGSYLENGRKKYHDEFRLMNDEGIQSTEFLVSSMVHKGSHLTKYRSESRMMAQIRAYSKEFLKELTLRMKEWGPVITIPKPRNPPGRVVSATPVIRKVDGEDVEFVRFHLKVQHPGLILTMVENTALQALQRGDQGFEAELTGKSWSVMETQQPQAVERPGREGFLKRFLRRGDDYD